MAFDYRRYEFKRDRTLIDPRNHFEKFKDKVRNPHTLCTVQVLSALFIYWHPWAVYVVDLLFFYNALYFTWFFFNSKKTEVPFRLPKTANKIDPGYKAPGTGKARMAEGILFLGNEERSSEEIWFTNTDARTHILYLGTTGSGKTEGLKALATNALGWGSGFIYVDGKADTDLWGAISALARRFGRDDDLLVLNYMTGNADGRVASNTVNPFSQGSASYLTNLLVSLMPEVQGDNAMWKDRAVALISALMPVMTWMRTHQEKPLNIGTIREALNFKKVIEYSRRPEVPERLRKGVIGYLDTLPGFTNSAFNDDGTEKPNPSGPPMDYSTIYQQHGYLAMQFTRQLQSLADDYGYIFEAPSADIDMMDVVLNRRIVVVLIPALEKSADETANLGKIIGSMLKGMMGATLGSSVEGDTDMALENKPTRSTTPFMAIFDEVGYYTTQGMAVMAAQARSLGFSLVFAGQDLPALEKRVKEEARSITANCNIKIFGKLEDPTQTKEFFEKTVGETSVVEAASRKEVKAMFGQKKLDKGDSINVTSRVNFSYNQLKDFKEGQAVISFGSRVVQSKMFYSDPGKIKSLRVNKFIPVPPADPNGKLAGKDVDAILERIRDRKWTAQNALSRTEDDAVIKDIAEIHAKARHKKQGLVESACIAMVGIAKRHDLLKPEDLVKPDPSAAPTPAPEKKEEPTGRREPFVEMPSPPASPAAEAPAAGPTASRDYEQQAAKATEETINWASLLADDDDKPASSTAASPVAASPVAPAVKQPPQPASMPSVDETISWASLVSDEDAKKERPAPVAAAPVAPSPPPTPPMPSATPPTGFGLGGFGSTGFGYPTSQGGIGGGIGGFGLSGLTPEKLGGVAKTPEEKLDKALKEGDTVNWKDLLKDE